MKSAINRKVIITCALTGAGDTVSRSEHVPVTPEEIPESSIAAARAGSQGGMAHMLDHFGPSLQSPWTRLVAAELTPALRDAMVEGCDQEAAGRSIDDLIAEQDRGVIAVLRALGRG